MRYSFKPGDWVFFECGLWQIIETQSSSDGNKVMHVSNGFVSCCGSDIKCRPLTLFGCRLTTAFSDMYSRLNYIGSSFIDYASLHRLFVNVWLDCLDSNYDSFRNLALNVTNSIVSSLANLSEIYKLSEDSMPQLKVYYKGDVYTLIRDEKARDGRSISIKYVKASKALKYQKVIQKSNPKLRRNCVKRQQGKRKLPSIRGGSGKLS